MQTQPKPLKYFSNIVCCLFFMKLFFGFIEFLCFYLSFFKGFFSICNKVLVFSLFYRVSLHENFLLIKFSQFTKFLFEEVNGSEKIKYFRFISTFYVKKANFKINLKL